MNKDIYVYVLNSSGYEEPTPEIIEEEGVRYTLTEFETAFNNMGICSNTDWITFVEC